VPARGRNELWASTGTKDPDAPDTLYIDALAAPDTVNTMPDKTLLAFADHGRVNAVMPAGGGDAQQVIGAFKQAGVDHASLAQQLQNEGAQSFDKSWKALMDCIESKREAFGTVAHT